MKTEEPAPGEPSGDSDGKVPALPRYKAPEKRAKKPGHIKIRRMGPWQEKFLQALAELPSVKHACIKAGIDRRAVYRHREKNPEFAAKWKDAIEHSIDDLEAKAFELALRGEDHVAAGLITWLLRCHRPIPYDPANKNELALLGGIVLLPAKKEGAE